MRSTGEAWSTTVNDFKWMGELRPHPLDEFGCEYAVYNQSVEPPTSDKVLVTVAIGKQFQELLELARPLFERYAERVGADYREIVGSPKYPIWQHEKFRVHDYAKHYDRSMFADVDCFIRDSCPDLFKIVPEDSVGMFDDFEFYDDVDWLTSERKNVSAKMGCEILGERCLNSGLIVHSRQHADIWRPPPRILPDTHYSEQIWIEHQINQIRAKVFLLEPSYNMQYCWNEFYEQNKHKSHIVHLSRCRDKLTVARELLSPAK
jgi:hypothetical protein